jgi:hypothetical protein
MRVNLEVWMRGLRRRFVGRKRFSPNRSRPIQTWDSGAKIVADTWWERVPVIHGKANEIPEKAWQWMLNHLITGSFEAGSHT